MLTFREPDRGRVARGEITVTYRLWERAHVKPGKTYKTGFGTVDVEDVQVIPAGLIDEGDVELTGCDSIAAIWRSAGEHKKVEVTPATILFRIQFRFRN